MGLRMAQCVECGSTEVFHDAWVSANDHLHVLFFDDTYCMRCDQPRSIEWVEEVAE